MKTFTLYTIALSLAVSGLFAQTTVSLQEGEVINVKLLDTLNSDKNQEGEIIYLEATQDIAMNGKVVIGKGSKATAMITKCTKRGVAGKPGEIEFSIDFVKAIDGQIVKLRQSSAGAKGKEKTTEAIVGAAVVTPVFLIMKGKAAIIPAGTTYNAYVDRSYQIVVQ